ncbi:Gfo/Idh/MocA family protein [Pseudarthrobacter sp. NBSH8]|uniref:Gfo/Idh/MocA family protein n=1 Tax=Pseudarthrobacter sp. NBSH8 TaxID=2596911 RepID=UPI00185F5A8E|nr:Gfo/Idh/MocA family oxidoreductase [Pseudarthrobacter sp. NBSH8]QNE13486.1 Gfo/Idh/MocA family oxidoreductase [Pseudarthrobacter sp. NBSH8]
MNSQKARPLGVAMIGYAFMGKAHSNAWRNVASFFDVPAFEQKVLVGRDAAGVAEAAGKYGWTETSTDWRTVIERDDIDIVDICAPGWLHAKIAIAALEAGKHVRLKKETAGSGALGDIASHAIDQVLFLLGDQVTEVSGRTHTFTTHRPGAAGQEEVTVDDAAWATLTLASGAIASVEVSRVATGQKNSLKLEIYGDKGAILFDLENLNELGFLDATGPAREQGFRRILVSEPEHPYVDAWWPQGHIIGWEHTFTHEIRDFLTAISTGTPPSPSFEDGLTVQRILNAIEESAAAKSSIIQLASAPAGTPTALTAASEGA